MKKKIIISLITIASTILAFLGIYYFGLPALSGQNFGFLLLIFILLGVVLSLVFMCVEEKVLAWNRKKGRLTYCAHRVNKATGKMEKYESDIENKYKYYPFKIVGLTASVALVFGMIVGVCSTPLFQAKRYAKQLNIEDGTSEEFNEEFKFDGDVLLPILDKELAFKAAQAKLSTYGSQYTIDSTNFTIISVNRDGKDELVRVTPLEYSDIFVSMNKNTHGSIGYIEVNVVTKETKLVEVEGGMKYMPSAIFNYDLNRHIRFHYPSVLYNETYFEIDDEGNPYWVVPTYKNEITLYQGGTPTGTIIVNPVNGDIDRYKLGEEPSWVDRVVEVELMEKQATNALRYKNGFFNTIFGSKKEVFQVSDGYNYFIKNGQTHYVSCITSPNEADQTSIGFLTINLKTKEAKKYMIPGITEMRAREIATLHESVKAQNLDATWPILMNYKGVPTYFLVLKNDVQPCKMVLLDVETGISIAMGDTMDEVKSKYDKLINNSSSSIENEVKELTSVVTRVQIFGDDIYFMLEGVEDKYFIVEKSVSLDAMFLKEADKVKITYVEYEGYNFVKTLVKVA